MKVTQLGGITINVFIVSGLLLVSAASCSFEGRREGAGVEQQAKEEPVESQVKRAGFVANLFCLACHGNFEDESLVVKHKVAGIGCERCHGESQRHRSDEANITPPEIMYPRAKINPTCMMCHPRGDIEHVNGHEVILAGAETVFDEKRPEGPEKVCTDCHGKSHRMNVRLVRWDKATGKVLE
jgi:hypothetical protein